MPGWSAKKPETNLTGKCLQTSSGPSLIVTSYQFLCNIMSVLYRQLNDVFILHTFVHCVLQLQCRQCNNANGYVYNISDITKIEKVFINVFNNLKI